MQNYESYSAKQFLDDASFIQWVKGTNPYLNMFWNDWIKSQPRNLEEMKAAEKQLRAILTAKQIKAGEEDAEEVWGRIDNSILKASPSKVRRMPQRWWAAAAIFLLLAAGSYFFINKEHSKKEVAAVKKNVLINDVSPGGNKAILTLANGATIILDNAKNGALTQQGNSKVVKLDDGKLAYNSNGTNSPASVEYNTVSTPRGGQYQLTLSDGSKVWLNAESAITFPTAFTGNDRKVTIKGEAYFEVAHDASKPFQVTVNGMQVQVLGTHFNINAYDDEGEIKTTLLEGSVKVSKGPESKLITPGQQAVVSSTEPKIVVQQADVDEAVAWKNGLFHFNNADLQEVMRQLSRWYDVNVMYDGTIPKREFAGEMQRDLNLSQVLELLVKNDVHFKIDGKKIIVLTN